MLKACPIRCRRSRRCPRAMTTQHFELFFFSFDVTVLIFPFIFMCGHLGSEGVYLRFTFSSLVRSLQPSTRLVTATIATTKTNLFFNTTLTRRKAHAYDPLDDYDVYD